MDDFGIKSCTLGPAAIYGLKNNNLRRVFATDVDDSMRSESFD